MTWDEFLTADDLARKDIWNEFKKDHKDVAEYWEDEEGCHGDITCEFANKGWCNYMNLPCGVNPYSTPKSGMLGMACMGDRPIQQLRIEF